MKPKYAVILNTLVVQDEDGIEHRVETSRSILGKGPDEVIALIADANVFHMGKIQMLLDFDTSPLGDHGGEPVGVGEN